MPTSTATALSTGVRQAAIPRSNPPELYLLPFGKGLFHVPQGAFMSFPKRANGMASGEALGELLATKAPEKWKAYLHPDTLCRIRGEEGANCVYTTFSVEGAPHEKRFLRHVSSTVAEKNFEKIKKDLKEEMDNIENERQQIRYDVLDWKKADECPNRAQLSPELEKWTQVTGDDVVKSVARAPETKKRPRPGQATHNETELMTCEYIAGQKFVKKPKNSTTKIIETDNLVHVIFYKDPAEEDDSNDI